MNSLYYYWAKTPLLRRALKWSVQKKIQNFQNIENQKLVDPLNIRNFEKKVFSQNGEDGIIEEIFHRIGTTNKFFVEFGVENGQECNGRYLLERLGWSGLWIDGSPENVKQAIEKFSSYPIKVIDRFITKENIVSLFEEGDVPIEPDLLSIDIDGNDYWIWKQLKKYKARVVTVEYNASYLPQKEWIMDYNPQHIFDGSSYFGASLKSFEILGRDYGYTLVGCDSMGVNAFFVRNDLIGNHFSKTEEGAEYHYCAPKYCGMSFGHPSWKRGL